MEGENLWMQLSRQRAEIGNQMETAGADEQSIRDRLATIVPRIVFESEAETATNVENTTDVIDTRWDVPDADGAMPDAEEAEDQVVARKMAQLEELKSRGQWSSGAESR